MSQPISTTEASQAREKIMMSAAGLSCFLPWIFILFTEGLSGHITVTLQQGLIWAVTIESAIQGALVNLQDVCSKICALAHLAPSRNE